MLYDDSMKPHVSWVIPFHNPINEWLGDAIDSIIGQNGDCPWELILVNDGTQDDILRETLYLAYELDPRIRLTGWDNECRGVAVALNHGISKARGDIIMRLDADDVAKPERMMLQTLFLEDEQDIDLVGTYVEFVDPLLKNIGWGTKSALSHDEAVIIMTASCPFYHPSIAFRKDLWERTGGYPTDYPHAEDYAWYLQVLQQGRVAGMDMPLTQLRRHPRRVSVTNQYEQRTSSDRVRTEAGRLFSS